MSANHIFQKIMENAIGSTDPSALKNFHVSQTADQLPDFKVRNSFYRAELERQIQEKREAEKRRREREAYEEERLLMKIEADREKVRREYLDEIDKKRIAQEEAERRHQIIAKRIEEMHEAEERKKEEEQERRRQQLIIDKRIKEIKEAVERRKAEEYERRRQRILLNKMYGVPYSSGTEIAKYYNVSEYQKPWNSRDYVHSAIQPDLILEDIYFDTPLPVLADVYKKLDLEKRRIKEIMRQRIVQGELEKYYY